MSGALSNELAALTDLAPLHQPACLAAIDEIAAYRPSLAQVASFDTSFHVARPVAERRYALPPALADQGIVANVVAPGWTRTPMTESAVDSLSRSDLRRIMPAARVADAKEIANVVRYLVVGAPSFLNGSTIYVDGGQTAMAPTPPL